MAQATKAMYQFTVDGEDPVELSTYGDAQQFLMDTIREFCDRGRMPAWRGNALLTHCDNLPRAGYSFILDGQMFKLSLVK